MNTSATPFTQKTFSWSNTLTVEAAHAALDTIKGARAVAVLMAESGYGKTPLLRSYAARHEGANSDVLLHRAEVVSTPRSLVQAMIATLGETWEGRTRPGFIYLAELIRIHRIRLVLVDDAQRVATNTMDLLRALHERTGAALVLAGPTRLPAVVMKKCPELGARVRFLHQLGQLELNEVCGLVREHVSPRSRLSFREWRALCCELEAASGGNFRRMQDILDDARLLARKKHRPLTPRLIIEAAANHPGAA